MNYKEQKQKLVKILDCIRECLTDSNFTNEEKAKFFEMASEILAMLMCL